MKIQTVVIHEIKKSEGETSADTFLTDQALDSSDNRIRGLISSLDKAFLEQNLQMMDSKVLSRISIILT